MGETNPLGTERERCWRSLLTGYARLSARLDADLRGQAGMSMNDYDVLVNLSEALDRRLPMHELATAVTFSRSGLTRLVDSLESRGLVLRERCPSDRRSWYAVLTPDGLAALRAAWPVHAAGVRDHFAAHASLDQLTAITEVFTAVAAGLEPCRGREACGEAEAP